MERQSPRPTATPERRRAGWGEFRRSYPGIVSTMALALLALLGIDGWLIYKRTQYEKQIAGLRSNMTAVERQKADVALEGDANRLQLTMALIRRQAAGQKALHLSVSTDSGKMYLEREGAILRVMPLRMGAEKAVQDGPDTVHIATPRGTRTVERILDEKASWEVPRWVYNDRHIPATGERTIKGALGPTAILLNGGTVIYSLPSVGPLNDSSYVMPGSVRVASDDLKAILPNLKPGMSVYFF
jgi:hypothetical protein